MQTWAGRVFAFLSAGADTKANTWGPVRGRGALELLDLRLLEDGSELGDALISDGVGSKTASKGWSGWAQNVFALLSAGADTKANTRESVRGRGVLEVGDLRLLEDGSERRCTLSSDEVLPETANAGGTVMVRE